MEHLVRRLWRSSTHDEPHCSPENWRDGCVVSPEHHPILGKEKSSSKPSFLFRFQTRFRVFWDGVTRGFAEIFCDQRHSPACHWWASPSCAVAVVSYGASPGSSLGVIGTADGRTQSLPWFADIYIYIWLYRLKQKQHHPWYKYGNILVPYMDGRWDFDPN